MSTYVTFKCDGSMPPGSRERCRGGHSVPVTVDKDGIVDMDAAWADAERHGWDEAWQYLGDASGITTLLLCPSCVRLARKEPDGA